MTEIIKIDDEVLTAGDFIKLLKLSGRFDGLLEDIVKEKLTVHAAKRQGIVVTPEAIQERADQIRRVRGLHRAAEMIKFLEALRISLDEFETFIVEMLYQEKMMEEVCNDKSVQEYFNLNLPRFDNIEISHILVDSEGKAREILSILEDEPEMFEDMAREHSMADTRDLGGKIGKVMRGSLTPEIESKVFNASEGDLLGPFRSGDNFFEIFLVNTKSSASLDNETKAEIRRLIRDEWLSDRVREHRIEPL